MKLARFSFIALALLSIIFVSCNKQAPVQQNPVVVNAGPDLSIQLPIDSVTLTGVITSGQTTDIVYSWTIISGPSVPTIINSNSTACLVKNLNITGTYIFQFQATIDGMVGFDTLSITVLPVNIVTVNAGPDLSVQLPTDTVTLNGTVKSGQTTNTVYSWSVISGPSVPDIVSNNSASTLVNNLVAGTYVFQFQATNSYGITGLDTTSVVVLPAGITNLAIQPSNNPNEIFLSSNNPTSSPVGQTYFWAGAWTINGNPVYGRFAIKFDLSNVPNTAVIESAKLFLYATPAPPPVGDKVNADYGTADACNIQRITTNWIPASTTWDNAPSTTTVDEAIIPQSISSFQNDSVDVTSIVKDIQTNGNYGFLIELQNETIYNIRQYESSYYSDPTLHPKLVITYQ